MQVEYMLRPRLLRRLLINSRKGESNMPDNAVTYEIETKNHCSQSLKWTSQNSDGSEFDSFQTSGGHDRHLHLPSATSVTVQVDIEDAGWTGFWCGTVNNGDHLVAEGSWPTCWMTKNGTKVESTC
jgi:hypothetical protein